MFKHSLILKVYNQHKYFYFIDKGCDMIPFNRMSFLFFGARRVGMATQQQRSFGRRSIHHQILNETESGAAIGEIKNDRKQGESRDAYSERSIQEFGQVIQPNQFYLYTERSSLKSGMLYPGHIVSFLTDKKGDIVDGSCVSLRRQKEKKEGVALKFSLAHDDSKQRHRTNPIWDVKFLGMEEELNEHLFRHARENFPLDKQGSRFLTGIPLSMLPESSDEIVERIKEMKQALSGSEYILADGQRILLPEEKIDKFVKAVNCITGVYGGLGVEGNELSPSTQMATTGLLKLILGEKEKDELTRDTGLRREDDEKRHGKDDEVSWTSGPTRGFKM